MASRIGIKSTARISLVRPTRCQALRIAQFDRTIPVSNISLSNSNSLAPNCRARLRWLSRSSSIKTLNNYQIYTMLSIAFVGILILIASATDDADICGSSSWSVSNNLPNQTINYSDQCPNSTFNSTNLTLQCPNSSQQQLVIIVFNQSLLLDSFSTTCSGVVINSNNIEIANISAVKELSYTAPMILQTYFIGLIAQKSNLTLPKGQFQASNYSLVLQAQQAVNLLNYTFKGLQVFIVSNSLIYSAGTNFNVTMASCNNSFGYQNIAKASRIQGMMEMRKILNDFSNNKYYDFNRLQTLFIASNFTFAMVTKSNISLSNTTISASQVMLYALGNLSISNKSTISLQPGCAFNQGRNGRGPAFYTPYVNCSANGGSNGGYGGVGLSTINGSYIANYACLLLTNSTRFMYNLYPYGYELENIYQGSGGGTLLTLESFSTQQSGFGGGAILINATLLEMNDSQILANGQVASNVTIFDGSTGTIGAGAGGSIIILTTQLYGSGFRISANGGDSIYNTTGEGGGGQIRFINTLTNIQFGSQEINISNLTNYNFTGSITVEPGIRNGAIIEGIPSANYHAMNGSIFYPNCPPFTYLASNNFSCEPCQSDYYKLTWGSTCVQCPNNAMFEKQAKSSKNKQNSNSVNSICPFYNTCKNQNSKCCAAGQQVGDIPQNTGIQLGCFIIILIIGFYIRRYYKKRESCSTDKNFDFAKETRQMISKKIITEPLMDNPNFQFEDLLYHAHRINVIGCNTFQSPWMIHQEPTAEIEQAVIKEEYFKFAMRFNKIAQWKKSEYVMLNVMAFIYYPLYWVLQTRYKKKRYNALKAFLSKNEICKFWKTSSNNDSNFVRLKMTKSADYTLLYIDVFNYKNSDLKYIFLTCPFIIYFSGEGNYLRPYYICESDQFLVSLFFATNKLPNASQSTRQKILENLVSEEEREENSKEIRRFLKKFNKVSMTLDYGAPVADFIESFKQVYRVLEKWNQNFFRNHDVRLDLLVSQVPFEAHQSAVITLIEYKSEQKLAKFLSDIHQNVNYKKVLDVKFGLFIFNTEQDPEEIDEQLQNQKFSFYDAEDQTVNVEQQEQLEDANYEMNQLKEQFLQKTVSKDIAGSHGQHQFNQIIDKDKVNSNKLSRSFYNLNRIVDYIRYQAFSHKATVMDKYALISLVGMLILLDNFLLQIILSIMIQVYENDKSFTFTNFQLLIFPYPFVIVLCNVLESLWIPTQSYGFIKLYLIFNAMAILQYLVNFMITIGQLTIHEFCILDAFSILSLLMKIVLNQLSERLISMSTKLNQLSNDKKQ